MTFSNVSIFQDTLLSLNTVGANSVSDKIVKGGAFAPNTMEAVSIMRVELDNQWENAFITKYQALMQNRLNRLKQELTNAYKALLEISSVQQVRENVATASASNFAVTDINGNIIKNSSGVCEAFKGLVYYEDENAFAAADALNGSTSDGIPSYLMTGVDTRVGVSGTAGDVNVEMRNLYTAGSALQIVNDMKVTFRTEEVPVKKPTLGSSVLDWMTQLGPKPFVGGEKVAEYSTEVKTGGFWSTINYLFNFSPREISYQYATSYSTTTEETGTRQIGGAQATLYDAVLVDGRDASKDNDATSMNDAGGVYTTTNKPPEGQRIKWASSNPGDGYYLERSPLFQFLGGSSGGGENGYDDREIVRRVSNNDDSHANLFQSYSSAQDDVKSNWVDTDTKNHRTIKEYGTEEDPDAPFEQRIIWEYDHNGKSAADLNQDGAIDNSDVHTAEAIFLNHYQVTTTTVKMNTDENSAGTITSGNDKFLRSFGIDGSAQHSWTDLDDDKKVDNIQSGDEREKMLTAGASNISKNFNGSFVEKQHRISTYNGQEINTTDANVRFSTQADSTPIELATFEGFDRAKSMTRGIATDIYSKTYQNINKDEADRLKQQIEAEINATTTVDTDFHYSQYNQTAGVNDRIKFIELDTLRYTEGGGMYSYDFKFNSAIKDNTTNNFKNINVGFRRTFDLAITDYCNTTYGDTNIPVGTENDNPFFIDSAKYDRKPILVALDFNNGNGVGACQLIVNGKILQPVTVGSNVFDISSVVESKENVIAVQGNIAQNNENAGLKLTAYTGTIAGLTNDASTISMIQSKLSTVQNDLGDNVISQLAGPTPALSSWQSKIMTSLATDQIAIDALGSKDTGTRVKDTNSFAVMLMDILNNPLYKDVFNLGLVNASAGKDIVIKSDVSAPTGGSITGVLNVKYDLNEKKFVLMQTKWDAAG